MEWDSDAGWNPIICSRLRTRARPLFGRYLQRLKPPAWVGGFGLRTGRGMLGHPAQGFNKPSKLLIVGWPTLKKGHFCMDYALCTSAKTL